MWLGIRSIKAQYQHTITKGLEVIKVIALFANLRPCLEDGPCIKIYVFGYF